jgi:hypothetical protein
MHTYVSGITQTQAKSQAFVTTNDPFVYRIVYHSLEYIIHGTS